jgi:osmotically-inducible protein OsmY
MMKPSMILPVALCFALIGGCTRAEKQETDRQVQGLGVQVENAADKARKAVTDAALAAKVKTALSTRQGLEGADIDVAAKGTVVTLKGDVNWREQSKEAEQVARGTTGVTAVVNQLMLRVPVNGAGSGNRPKSVTGT